MTRAALVCALVATVSCAPEQEGRPPQAGAGERRQEGGAISAGAISAVGGMASGQVTPLLEPGQAERAIGELAGRAVSALRDRQLTVLAEMVHPEAGVRFSPYGYVDTERDLVFSRAQLPALADDETPHLWGLYDGSGEPIRLRFSDYYERFVYDRDFADAERIGFNTQLGRGNSPNNAHAVYPGAIVVEYHFSGLDPQYDGLDWRSLRLAFVPAGERWLLVGIIHDEWTT